MKIILPSNGSSPDTVVTVTPLVCLHEEKRADCPFALGLKAKFDPRLRHCRAPTRTSQARPWGFPSDTLQQQECPPDTAAGLRVPLLMFEKVFYSLQNETRTAGKSGMSSWRSWSREETARDSAKATSTLQNIIRWTWNKTSFSFKHDICATNCGNMPSVKSQTALNMCKYHIYLSLPPVCLRPVSCLNNLSSLTLSYCSQRRTSSGRYRWQNNNFADNWYRCFAPLMILFFSFLCQKTIKLSWKLIEHISVRNFNMTSIYTKKRSFEKMQLLNPFWAKT